MRTLIIFISLLLASNFGLGQTSSMLQTTRDRINLSGLTIPRTGVLFGFDGAPGQLLGDGYLDTTFQAGIIRFYGRIGQSDTLAGVPIRLDLLANEVEIRASATDIRVAKGPSVKQFAMNNAQGGVSQFVNVREYRGDADVINGFFEWVLPIQTKPGTFNLLLHPFVSIKKGNYNAALNVGSKDDQILKKTDWYAARNGPANPDRASSGGANPGRANPGGATKFSPTKKAILELMADKKDQIETYLKTEKLDLKTQSGIVAVFAYYNSL